ncbi:hypothetical protein AYI70_g133 [Smittium culicis]|uniref:Altered inheritance of mitochondria protein 41 n=1 Tax=Smittium culicis TaxID=133412 RepID=A0A1R1YHX9_9FUNG|nr:hypothetical protein AYI70_g133 [Smittium culicis]
MRLTLIKSLLSEIKYAELEQKTKLPDFKDTDSKVIPILQKAIQQRKESFEVFAKAGRDTMADLEQAQIRVIEEYLPAQLSDDEIRAMVKATIDKLQVSDIKSMGLVMKNLNIDAALAPKQKISEIVKSLLTK